MTQTREAPARSGGAGTGAGCSLLGGENIQPNSPSKQPRQPRRGGRSSRDKGGRLERAVVRLLQDAGLGAERVPLSGAAGGSCQGDLTVPILGRDLTIEAKSRKNGFRELYAWLDGRDGLVVKADRREALVILPLRLAVEIAAAAERTKGGQP
jgi:Holliday junction resolvase